MRPTPSSPPAPDATFGVWLMRALAIAMAFALMLYGLTAIDAGIVNFRDAGSSEAVAKRLEMQANAESGRPIGTDEEITEHLGVMVTALNKVSSATYAFGKDGLSEASLFYASMPRGNGIVLSLHNVLGGTCMLFGAMQFWPAFRRRFPIWHRTFGGIYLVAAQVAMIASMIYLVRTPIANIYDQLTFYVGLWGLAIGVTVSLWMAVYSMLRKQIAQHQAWMCINYGMLLTAPIQRFGWMAFGAADPEMRQIVGNYGVTAMLVPLCAMLGYALFTLNRWTQSERSAPARAKIAQAFDRHGRIGRALVAPGLLVLAAAALTTVQHMVLTPGLAQASELAPKLIPAGVIQMEDAVIADHAAGRWAFALATLLGLLAGARLMWQAFLKQPAPSRFMGRGAWLLAASGVVTGSILLNWGLSMGMPSFETLSGGASAAFGGSITLVFSVLLMTALLSRRPEWVKEWSLFVIACLVATPSFYWYLAGFGLLEIDPQFVQTGHVFRMSQYGQWLALIGAFVYASYSEATHTRLAR
ncbi:MAG: DUF2306 domain-containing protein [Burkholderiales bacterium]|nr:DUF2306 domain-containing protein [Burkholderiales bacterium]MBH2015435.1 DUF2306 domain-containing protein [Burkholderiales bacterium]